MKKYKIVKNAVADRLLEYVGNLEYYAKYRFIKFYEGKIFDEINMDRLILEILNYPQYSHMERLEWGHIDRERVLGILGLEYKYIDIEVNTIVLLDEREEVVLENKFNYASKYGAKRKIGDMVYGYVVKEGYKWAVKVRKYRYNEEGEQVLVKEDIYK